MARPVTNYYERIKRKAFTTLDHFCNTVDRDDDFLKSPALRRGV